MEVVVVPVVLLLRVAPSRIAVSKRALQDKPAVRERRPIPPATLIVLQHVIAVFHPVGVRPTLVAREAIAE